MINHCGHQSIKPLFQNRKKNMDRKEMKGVVEEEIVVAPGQLCSAEPDGRNRTDQTRRSSVDAMNEASETGAAVGRGQIKLAKLPGDPVPVNDATRASEYASDNNLDRGVRKLAKLQKARAAPREEAAQDAPVDRGQRKLAKLDLMRRPSRGPPERHTSEEPLTRDICNSIGADNIGVNVGFRSRGEASEDGGIGSSFHEALEPPNMDTEDSIPPPSISDSTQPSTRLVAPIRGVQTVADSELVEARPVVAGRPRGTGPIPRRTGRGTARSTPARHGAEHDLRQGNST